MARRAEHASRMDDAACPEPDWNHAIVLLRLEAGRIIEHAVDALASGLGGDTAAGEARLAVDRLAADDIAALLAAAQVLHRRCLALADTDPPGKLA